MHGENPFYVEYVMQIEVLDSEKPKPKKDDFWFNAYLDHNLQKDSRNIEKLDDIISQLTI